MSRTSSEHHHDGQIDMPSEHQPHHREEESVALPQTPPAGRRMVIGIIIGLAILASGIIGVRYWQYATTHETTDNATLTGDVIQIAPQVSGTVKAVHVIDNQHVEAGQLLVELDDETFLANVKQAEANLAAAIAQSEGADIGVDLTSENGNAQIVQAQAGVAQVDSVIGSAQADVDRAHATVQQATSAAQGAKAQITTAEATVAAAQAQKKRAQAAVAASAAQINTVSANVKAAQAAVDAAQAVAEKAANDNKRYQQLLAQGAIGEQMAEQATVGLRTANSQVASAKEQVIAANAILTAYQSEYAAAVEQVNAADAGIAQAKAQLVAATQQYQSSLSGITQAQAMTKAATKNVTQAQARRAQAIGQLTQAQTTPKQVGVSQSSAKGAQARIDQARAALELAKLQLSYTRVYAPVSGVVSKKIVQQGVLVQPGLPLMAVVPPPPTNIWVVANYKETQLRQMQPGNTAIIEVDTFPDHKFTAKVESIAQATGATFALLPPDNATGNFTKVVQRIPVKLLLDADQPDLERLRAGMSVSVSVAIQ